MLPENMRVKGTVVAFNDKKGSGFIRPNLEDFKDVFISHREIEPHIEGFKTLLKGDKVIFDLTYTKENGYFAKNLKIIRE